MAKRLFPNEELLELIEKFGLDTTQVKEFKLIVDDKNPVTVEVKMNITPEQLGYAIGVLRKYELVECQATQ